MTLTPNPEGMADVQYTAESVRLLVRRGSRQFYSNAQLDDHAGLPRASFPNTPPLIFSLKARFSHEAADGPGGGLQGTAGFGFWNDPFMMTNPWPPTLPAALWFFYASPPSDMKLDASVPGWGWKAAAVDVRRRSAIGPALAAPILFPLLRFETVYRRAWPPIQRRFGIAEALVPGPMTEWRQYTIDWADPRDGGRARFFVDGVLLLDTPAPRGPLGLVIWCDNQYMIAKPWGKLAHGALDTGEQWLEVADIEVRPGGGEG